MTTEINEMTELACEDSTEPLTTTPVVGTPRREFADVLTVGAEPVATGEVRVTILGSGDPFVKKGQASASVLIEVGNQERTCSSSTSGRVRWPTSPGCACRSPIRPRCS